MHAAQHDAPTRGRHLVDDGMPVALAATGLDDSFRYWRGASGARFVFSVSPVAAVTSVSNAVVVLATNGRDGSREAVWIGRGDSPEFRLARAASVAAGATEMHLHMTSSPLGADRIVRDLKAAIPIAPLKVNFA
ncbi:hypothetical protein ACKTEK_13625 [Tepidamorphus sp. 3E244]|uniref:hypothetical protein n=1 Tax=Tepidamorphus sp. 3E244 TaxID=3385498 RepID=UPI0038FC22EF